MKLKNILLLILSLFSSFIYAQVDEEEDFELPEDTLTLQLESCGCPKIDSIVDFALTKRYSRYKYGNAGPNYFDCSGLMYYAFKHFGITLNRSSRDQYLMGKKVPNSKIQKGDLVFFRRGKGVGHVGLVIQTHPDGSYKFFHASNAKNGIRIDESTRAGYLNTFVGAKRIVDCATNAIFQLSPEDSILTSSELTVDSAVLYATHAPAATQIAAQPATATAQLTVAPKQSAKPKMIIYTTRSGDTLYSLARKHHTTVDKIMKLNKLHSSNLQIGQRLKIERQ
ncbi:MAG: C40 family peptidase [Bacteroidales bacterium]|jgi:LysM repeat protein|nr:C40 family peptidase [Bacteroidales bacterium]